MHFREQVLPYLKYLPTAALFFGLIFDIFTLNRPDALFENVVIIGYLVLSAVLMLLLQARADNGSESKRLLMLSILQFSFGNLASALMVLYARSGTLTGSAIFIGILALLFLGNELLRDRYKRTHLRIVIWFSLVLTYSTLAVPVLFNSIDTFVFILSIIFALATTLILVFALSKVARTDFKKRSQRILVSITIITIGFSGLYITNLIPPVPLALKHIGIYHSVARIGNLYEVALEPPAWYEFWRDTNKVFNHTPGTLVYCFTSVFAPSDLKTEIRHRWEKYDTNTEEWITTARIPFPILGGRADGFRGFTQTRQISEGTWRCSVETARGTLIGRTTFQVEGDTPILQQKNL
ncbi:MAG: DUF2914 domain-containing protein [Candidatus Pacebacteria bacterium]|nr:DUF2914 domain-containing protein [Candidatus Paceibacterota bacterium]